MYNTLLTACDLCGGILEGRSGTAQVKKDHLGVKGSLFWAHKDEEGEIRYTYALPKQESFTPLHFCNEKCLMDFLKAKQALFEQKRDSWQDEKPKFNY